MLSGLKMLYLDSRNQVIVVYCMII